MPDLFICSLGVPLCSPLRSPHRHGKDTRTYTYVMYTGCSASGLRIVQTGLHPPCSSSEVMHPLCREDKTFPAIRIATRSIICLVFFFFFSEKTYLYFCRKQVSLQNCFVENLCIVETKFLKVSWNIYTKRMFAILLKYLKIS